MSAPEGDRAGPRRLAAGPALVVAVLLLCVLFAVALGSGPRGTGVALPTVEPGDQRAVEDSVDESGPVPSPTPTASPTSTRPPAAFGYVLAVVLALAVSVLLFWAVRLLSRVRFRRDQVRPRVTQVEPESDLPEPDEVREEVGSAVRRGLRQLDEGDPRGAVIGCWVALEEAAASAGTERRPDETPTELVARLLAAHRISAEGLDRLAELYRRARYAPDDVADSMRDEARETLSRLASELSGAGS